MQFKIEVEPGCCEECPFETDREEWWKGTKCNLRYWISNLKECPLSESVIIVEKERELS